MKDKIITGFNIVEVMNPTKSTSYWRVSALFSRKKNDAAFVPGRFNEISHAEALFDDLQAFKGMKAGEVMGSPEYDKVLEKHNQA